MPQVSYPHNVFTCPVRKQTNNSQNITPPTCGRVERLKVRPRISTHLEGLRQVAHLHRLPLLHQLQSVFRGSNLCVFLRQSPLQPLNTTTSARHRASTSMYLLTFRVRVTTPEQYGRNGTALLQITSSTQQARRFYRW